MCGRVFVHNVKVCGHHTRVDKGTAGSIKTGSLACARGRRLSDFIADFNARAYLVKVAHSATLQQQRNKPSHKLTHTHSKMRFSCHRSNWSEQATQLSPFLLLCRCLCVCVRECVCGSCVREGLLRTLSPTSTTSSTNPK